MSHARMTGIARSNKSPLEVTFVLLNMRELHVTDYADPALVAVRALNYLRRDHRATYVALRFFLDSLGVHARADWISLNLQWRKKSGLSPAYFRSKVLKGVSSVGVTEYRDFYVPSPATMMVDPSRFE